MKSIIRLCLLGLVTSFVPAALAQATPVPATAQPAGKIVAKRAKGTVTHTVKATKATAPLTDDLEISEGTVVHTAKESSVVLLFSNGATINLGPDSELDIEQFTQDPFASVYEPSKSEKEPTVSKTKLNLTRGELVGQVKKLNKAGGSDFTVGTPVGAAGIRGTTFRIVFKPTSDGKYTFTLTTIEGHVEVTLASGTVNAPPVSVTDNKEVVVENIVVKSDPVTQVVTATAPTITATSIASVVEAPPATIQQVRESAQVIAQAIATAVFAPPAPTTTTDAKKTDDTTTKPDDTTKKPDDTTKKTDDTVKKTDTTTTTPTTTTPTTTTPTTTTTTVLAPGSPSATQGTTQNP